MDQPPSAAQEGRNGIFLPRNHHQGRLRAHFLEAVYCVAGNGRIRDLSTGEVHEITDGTLYALDNHDKHILYGGTEDMRLICAFNPPVTGQEVHDEDGAYLPDSGDN